MRAPLRHALTACVLAVVLALTLAPAAAFAAGFVIDEAGIIPADVAARIEDLSTRIEAATPGAQIAVVTVSSLGGKTIEEYGIERARALGVGAADKDNGVILIVAPNERKVRIEVGYGLEGALTDAKAGAIIDEAITPAFKAGDYGKGIEAGHARIAAVVADEYGVEVTGTVEPAAAATDMTEIDAPWWCVCLVFLAFVIVAFIIMRLMRRRGGDGGGWWTSGGGGWTDTWSSGSSGGDSGGSSFGGGDFGGGGASGDW